MATCVIASAEYADGNLDEALGVKLQPGKAEVCRTTEENGGVAVQFKEYDRTSQPGQYNDFCIFLDDPKSIDSLVEALKIMAEQLRNKEKNEDLEPETII